MSRCRTILGAVAFAVVVSVVPSRDAHAELIDFGAGMIYDSEQDLTWLDPAFAQPGQSTNTYYGATEWADSLSHEGYDDWRLPSRLDTSIEGGDNEVHRMLAQLEGWVFGPNLNDTVELLGMGDSGPFRTRQQYYFVWMHNEAYTYTHYMGYDIPDRLDFQGQARAVRKGAPTRSVPEPSTLGLLTLGAVAALGFGRRLARPKA
jgi:hypothetical protein